MMKMSTAVTSLLVRVGKCVGIRSILCVDLRSTVAQLAAFSPRDE